MAASEAERGQTLLQNAEEALQHAVQWGGYAHLWHDRARALLDELARLRAEEGA